MGNSKSMCLDCIPSQSVSPPRFLVLNVTFSLSHPHQKLPRSCHCLFSIFSPPPCPSITAIHYLPYNSHTLVLLLGGHTAIVSRLALLSLSLQVSSVHSTHIILCLEPIHHWIWGLSSTHMALMIWPLYSLICYFSTCVYLCKLHKHALLVLFLRDFTLDISLLEIVFPTFESS